MSVPAYKRQKPDPNSPRDPEFVLLSKKLYVEVIDLLACMSARYGRLIAVPTAELAGEVQDYAVKANDVFPSDGQKLALRREYLLRCHAAAKALGERMDKVHEVLRSNPEGAFRNGKGVTLGAEAALKKLHRMETDVGAAGRGRGGGAGGVHRTVRGAGAAGKPQEMSLRAAAAALPLLQDEVPCDGNGPGGDAPHRGRTEALPAENAPAGR